MRGYAVTEYDTEDYRNWKDNMSNEEAIKLLNYIKRGYIPDYNYDGSESDFEHYKLHMAILKAIDTLERYL